MTTINRGCILNVNYSHLEMTSTLLQSRGLKVTQQRLALLSVLRKQRKPQTVEKLQERVPVLKMPTVYRMLEDFVAVDLAHRVDLGHGHAHYEFADPNNHHHHLVCQDCGDVQDVIVPEEEKVVARVARRHRFAVRSHSFELFGLCRSCQLAI